MKRCPYCAEEIQDAAIVCRYCGRDLPKESVLSPTPPSESSKPMSQEPGIGISLLLGLLLLVAMYGIGIGIVLFWSGSPSQLQPVIVGYQIVVMFVLGSLASSVLNPQKASFLRWLGLVILGMVPVLGWIVLYWGGRGIARSPNRGMWLGVLTLLDVTLVGIGGVILFPAGEPAKPIPSTQTPYFAGTVFASATQTLESMYSKPHDPMPSPGVGNCIPWISVKSLPDNTNVCVYGKVAYVASYNEAMGLDYTLYWTNIYLTEGSQYIRVPGELKTFAAGDCITAAGRTGPYFLAASEVSQCLQ